MDREKARKRGKTAKVDTSGKEESEECSVSSTDYIQFIFKYGWVCWVYIKIILKLVAFYIHKTKDLTDNANIKDIADAIADSDKSLNPLIRNLFSFFIFWDGIFLEYIKPSYLLIFDEVCSIYYKDGPILFIAACVTLAL